jgi:hypothetical protein
VIRPTVTVGGIAMARNDNIDAHVVGALNDSIKIVHLKPKQDPVSIWFVIAITNRAVMMLHLEAMQLEDELAI